jgi:hypothetical protein
LILLLGRFVVACGCVARELGGGGRRILRAAPAASRAPSASASPISLRSTLDPRASAALDQALAGRLRLPYPCSPPPAAGIRASAPVEQSAGLPWSSAGQSAGLLCSGAWAVCRRCLVRVPRWSAEAGRISPRCRSRGGGRRVGIGSLLADVGKGADHGCCGHDGWDGWVGARCR